MKVFVSSRMTELLVERKTAIEVVHFSGHTPLYIETEPEVKDEAARQVMLSLLADADGFLSLHYLSEGRQDEAILNNFTPIEFELVEFIKLHPNKPVLLFRRRPDDEVVPSPHLARFFRQKAEALKTPIIDFRTPGELHERLLNVMSHYKSRRDPGDRSAVLVVRYLGPDFIGLVGKVSEVLFTRHRLNIDYVSHASRDGAATLCLSCSPRDIEPQLTSLYAEQVRTDIETGLRQVLDENARGNSRKARQASQIRDSHFQLIVDLMRRSPRPPQFYVEVRTIDAPGQLNAICKALRDRHFNIDDLQQRPTPAEYHRQATSVWWLSKPGSKPKDQRENLAAIEAALQYLVGVRSFSIKVIQA